MNLIVSKRTDIMLTQKLLPKSGDRMNIHNAYPKVVVERTIMLIQKRR